MLQKFMSKIHLEESAYLFQPNFHSPKAIVQCSNTLNLNSRVRFGTLTGETRVPKYNPPHYIMNNVACTDDKTSSLLRNVTVPQVTYDKTRAMFM